MNNKQTRRELLCEEIDSRIKISTKLKGVPPQNSKTVMYKVESSAKDAHRTNKGDLNLKRKRILEEGLVIRKDKGKTKN